VKVKNPASPAMNREGCILMDSHHHAHAARGYGADLEFARTIKEAAN
jgi:hypothetical protein